ncbi:MAG: hypothetical protein FJW20_25725 [Acidimicrobiia bacterium]|nr:hypothetical protein [Acidimicrobiia bacterium]
MDTRAKILSWPTPSGALPPDAVLVAGSFDPLLAAHASRLEQLARKGPLFILITDPDSPLLPRLARAELVAGLREVRAVLVPPLDQIEPFLASFDPARVVRTHADDLSIRAHLTTHVHQRHNRV